MNIDRKLANLQTHLERVENNWSSTFSDKMEILLFYDFIVQFEKSDPMRNRFLKIIERCSTEMLEDYETEERILFNKTQNRQITYEDAMLTITDRIDIYVYTTFFRFKTRETISILDQIISELVFNNRKNFISASKSINQNRSVRIGSDLFLPYAFRTVLDKFSLKI